MNTDLKERILDSLKLSDGYKEYYSRYFKRDDKKDFWQVKCPFHFDHNPSLNINTLNGLYHCFGCGEKGDIFSFRMIKENLDFRECLEKFAEELNLKYYKNDTSKKQNDPDEEYIPPNTVLLEQFKKEFFSAELDEYKPQGNTNKSENDTLVNEQKEIQQEHQENITEKELFEKIKMLNDNLFSESGKTALDFLNNKRGFDNNILKKYLIGYDSKKGAISIPFPDEMGENIPTVKYFYYDFNTGTKKITTYGKSQLFGLNYFIRDYSKHDIVIIAEGEFDALLLNQLGLLAVSGSSGANTWKDDWSKYFKDKNVVVCYDSDDAGERGAEKIIRPLLQVVKSIKNISLFSEKNNKERKDITDFFLKENHTMEELKKLINNAEDIKVKPDGISSETYYDLKTERDAVEVRSAQDFVDGELYYAVKINNETYLINSRRKCIPVKDSRKNGIITCFPDIDTFKFSREGILDYLHGRAILNPADIYNHILDYIQRFIFLQNSRSYIFLSLWAMGTYVFKVFRYYPYVHLNAEKGSGKTLLMEVLAPICYNGQISCNSSEAVIYRDIQNNSLTIFLDEVERLSKEDKDKYNAIMNVLKTGFSRSGMVKRCGGKNKDKIYKFSTYSPKMFAGIRDLDDVLLDRAIRIPMVRKLDSECTERYTESESITRFQKDIRDKLYTFGLTYAKEISDTYTDLSEDIEGLEYLNNRELDIWLPILLLANIVDKNQKYDMPPSRKAMIEYSREMIQYKKENDHLKNDTVLLLKTLNNLINEVPAERESNNHKTYYTDSVYEYFQKQDEFDWLNSKVWLSKQLKKLNIKISALKDFSKLRKIYIVDLNNLKDLSKRYGVNEVEAPLFPGEP